MEALEVRLAQKGDRLVIKNMIELYLHDLSEYWDYDLDEHGQYGYMLDNYWGAPNHFAFVFLVEGRYAGFALIDDAVSLSENERWMGQFFVLRKYRRQGIGSRAAKVIFDTLPAKWEIGQVPANVPAQMFWRKMIQEYTNGQFSDSYLKDDSWDGPLQCFDNRFGFFSSDRTLR